MLCFLLFVPHIAQGLPCSKTCLLLKSLEHLGAEGGVEEAFSRIEGKVI